MVDIGRVGYAPRRQFGSGQATTRAVHENGNLKLDTCTVTTNTEGIFSEQLWQIILLPRNALKNAKDVKALKAMPLSAQCCRRKSHSGKPVNAPRRSTNVVLPDEN